MRFRVPVFEKVRTFQSSVALVASGANGSERSKIEVEIVRWLSEFGAGLLEAWQNYHSRGIEHRERLRRVRLQLGQVCLGLQVMLYQGIITEQQHCSLVDEWRAIDDVIACIEETGNWSK